MKTQILFFFDTEDYTSPENADAILGITKILEEEGVTGHFAVVGLLAEQLTNWGREDVKAALQKHIIGNHTYAHTMHPDIAEMSDEADYEVAHKKVLEMEMKSVSLLKKHLNVENPMFAVPPGNSVSPVAMYSYHEMGIPFYCDAPIKDGKYSLMDYCAMTVIPYGYCFEELLSKEHPSYNEILDELQSKDRIIMYLHPNMCFKTEYWDILNYYHENIREFGDWIPAQNRPIREVIEYWHDIRMLIRQIQKDDRFEIVTLHDIKSQMDAKKPVPITKENIAVLADAIKLEFSPKVIPGYCISDLFYAAVALLRGETAYVPGTVKGFLDKAKGVLTKTDVSKEDLISAAGHIKIGDFIPEYIEVDGKKIGPADYLFAALEVLKDNSDTVTLHPCAQQIDLSDYPELNDMDLRRDLWCRSYDFADNYVSDRMRLQSWTMRYWNA